MVFRDDFVPDLLSDLDEIRGIGGEIGMRPFVVRIRQRYTRGPVPGIGLAPAATSFTDVDTLLMHAGFPGQSPGFPVGVRQVARRDVIASGGRYQDTDLRVGPLTPSYIHGLLVPQDSPMGGYGDSDLDPIPPASPVQIFWLVSGPGMPDNMIFAKVGEEATALHYFAIIRNTGRQIQGT